MMLRYGEEQAKVDASTVKEQKGYVLWDRHSSSASIFP